MKKNTMIALSVMTLSCMLFNTGCAENKNDSSTTTMRTTSFDGVQGSCTNGGVKIEVLVNGSVDDTQTQYICNGAQGAQEQDGTNNTIMTTAFDDAQGNCTNGGVKIEVLVDGSVDDTQTQYICNGTQGQGGPSTNIQTTTFDDAQGDCTNGGVKIEVLVNGSVDDTQTQYICNGANGTNGTNASIMTTAFDNAQGDCSNGGVKIEVLVNGSVDDTQTQYICNGANGIGGCTTDNDCRETAYCDQTTFICIDKKEVGESCTQDNQCLRGICYTGVCRGIGSIITFGHYEQDNDTTNGQEPIEWLILDYNDEGQILLISEKVLDAKLYNSTDISITWEKSTIRSWLNGYAASYNTVGTNFTSDNFINTAFTAEEQAKIVASTVPAHVNPSNNSTSPGNATTDKIFLLSVVEWNNYFIDNSARRADATRYAVKKGAYVLGSESGSETNNGTCTDVHCYADWWLRSPGGNSNRAAYVYFGGTVEVDGSHVGDVIYGIRPALWVKW